MSDPLYEYLRKRRADRRAARASELAPQDPVGCFPMSALDDLEDELAAELAAPPIFDLFSGRFRSLGDVILPQRDAQGFIRRHHYAEKFVLVGEDPGQGELELGASPSEGDAGASSRSDTGQN